MNLRTCLMLQLLIVAAMAGYSIYMNGKLPEIVPTHWNIEGKPDGFGSKGTLLWMMPGIALAMCGLTLVLPKLSPKNYEISRFEGAYSLIMVIVTGMFFALQIVIVQASLGAKFDMMRWMLAIMFAFFMLLGNVLGKTKPNFYMGIRTPWTIADERVWTETHRSAGKLWFFGSFAGMVAALLGAPFVVLFPLLMSMALWPVVHSYFLYRKLHPELR